MAGFASSLSLFADWNGRKCLRIADKIFSLSYARYWFAPTADHNLDDDPIKITKFVSRRAMTSYLRVVFSTYMGDELCTSPLSLLHSFGKILTQVFDAVVTQFGFGPTTGVASAGSAQVKILARRDPSEHGKSFGPHPFILASVGFFIVPNLVDIPDEAATRPLAGASEPSFVVVTFPLFVRDPSAISAENDDPSIRWPDDALVKKVTADIVAALCAVGRLGSLQGELPIVLPKY